MDYALIENGIVSNIITLNSSKTVDFPNAVPIYDIPVIIGDQYIDGAFYRNGVEIKSNLSVAEESDVLPEFVIDNDLRIIKPPRGKFILGVEGDADVNKVRFVLPRVYRGVDLSTFGIRINYRNASKQKGVYPVTDATFDTSSITFTWLIGESVVKRKGNVNFVVCLREIKDETRIREFNTTIATGTVLEGLEPDDPTPENPSKPVAAAICGNAICGQVICGGV